jgi:hypothetical protein
MLDGAKQEIAAGFANDQYVFWLGSGISRERMPDLRALGSGLVDHSQKMTVAARAMAEKKAVGQRS